MALRDLIQLELIIYTSLSFKDQAKSILDFSGGQGLCFFRVLQEDKEVRDMMGIMYMGLAFEDVLLTSSLLGGQYVLPNMGVFDMKS